MVMKFVDRIYPPEPEPEPAPEPEPEDKEEDTEGGMEPTEPEQPAEPEEPVVPEVKPDKNGVILPAEYKGFTIEANKNGYFYMNASGKKVYCEFKGWKNEADSLIIDFWFDSSTNYFVPMVVEVTKK